MGKYSGMIGFAENQEVATDIYDDVITERHYYGDIVRNTSRWSQADTLSGDLQINNQFSIMGDTYAFENYDNIRYLTWKNNRWTVTSVEEQFPRLIISIGGIYNGQTPEDEHNA